jgi:hypothetical protein
MISYGDQKKEPVLAQSIQENTNKEEIQNNILYNSYNYYE